MGNPNDKRGSEDIDLPIIPAGEDSPAPPITADVPNAETGGAANAIGPAGSTANQDIDPIASGQPAGGPFDLGEKAARDRSD